MKRDIAIGIIVLAIVAFCFSNTPAFAEEAISFKPSSVSVLKDRNGNEYVRMIWGQTKELNGISYSTGATVNAYGDLVGQAKQFKPGQEVHAVVQKREFNGTTYYTVLGFKSASPAKKGS